MTQTTNLNLYSKLVFSRPNDLPLMLDLYVPQGVEGKVPVIVWIYGGAFRERNNHLCPILPIVHKGYAVAQIDYRMSWESIFPAQAIDCKAAIRWLKAHAEQYGLDAERIGVWGESSGGNLAAMLGVSSGSREFEVGEHLEFGSDIKAVCDFFGPTDFLQMDAAGSSMKHDAPDSPESELIGGPIQENPELTSKANPISYVHDSVPPFLILHGDRDPLVPLHQSELLYEALKKFGNEVELISVPGEGHRHFTSPELMERVHHFFDSHLK